MPLYSITKWFGGMSNDEYAGPSGAVYDARNVDLSNSKGVKLSRSFNFTRPNLLFTQAQGKPIALINYGSFTNRLIASQNGILKNIINTEYDISAKTSQIYNMGIINNGNVDYGFILGSQGKIWRWNLNSSVDLGIGTGGVNVVDSGISLPNDTNGGSSTYKEKSPYLLRGDFLYVVGGNGKSHNIYRINLSNSSTWVADSNFLVLDRGYEVRYMSAIGDQIVIYTTNGNNGKQYFRNGLPENSYERYIDWYDRPILGGATINNVDYIISGTARKRGLYQVQGYQANKITETDVYVNNIGNDKYYYDTENGGSNIIETIGDTLVLPGYEWIYKYGNNKIGLPKNITRDRLVGLINLIYYNDTYGDQLTVCTQSSSYNGTFGYYIALTNLRQPNDNIAVFPTNTPGIIEGLKFDGNAYSIKKQAVKCKIGYSLPTIYNTDNIIDNGINIYARVDGQYEYANFYTYVYSNGSYTTKPSIGDVYSVDGKNFTIYDITDKTNLLSNGTEEEIKNQGLILHTKCEDKRYSINKQGQFTGVLTKVSGDGDSSVRFYNADEGYELIKKIRAINTEDLNKKEDTFMFSKDFYEIQFKFDLFTNEATITPELREFYLQYNFIQNQLGN